MTYDIYYIQSYINTVFVDYPQCEWLSVSVITNVILLNMRYFLKEFKFTNVRLECQSMVVLHSLSLPFNVRLECQLMVVLDKVTCSDHSDFLESVWAVMSLFW